MGRSGWVAWTVDVVAVSAAIGILIAVGDQRFGPRPLGPGTTTGLFLTWATTASAVLVIAAAAAGRHPPRTSGAGGVALALVIGGLAAVDVSPAIRVAAVATAALFVVAVAAFVGAVLDERPRLPFLVLTVTTLVAVVARVAVRDPFREVRCAPYCRQNPLLVAARPNWVLAADRVMHIVALGWCVATVVQIARSRSSVWSRTSAGFAVAAAALASAVSLVEPGLSIWGGSTAWAPALVPAALIPALVLAHEPDVRVWRTRVQARELASALADSFGGGGVSGHLQRVVRDPSIRLLFPSGPDTYLGPDGKKTERDGGLAVTTVERDGEAIALIEHEPSSRGVVGAALSPAVTVAVENEHLRALATAELAALRASRRRIVERADAIRRRLDRDLHDGAQQRLLLLGMELSSAAENADLTHRERYLAAIGHTRDALAELRNLIHEQFPPVLDELGLVEALRSLAETSLLPLRILPDSSIRNRPPHEVEHVVYTLVQSMINDGHAAGASHVTIRLTHEVGTFSAIVGHDAPSATDPVDDEDRVGAVGGNLVVTTGPGGLEYVASFP